TAALPQDTLAQRLLGDTGAPAPRVDTTARGATAPTPADTARARAVAPGTPGRLTLQGLPRGAHATLNGQPLRGAQVDLPPGTYQRAVRAAGFDPRSVHLRGVQPRHVQQRSAGHGQEPALEPGPEERRSGGCVGQVAVPAGEAVIHIHPTAFIAPGAVVLGDVTLAARASVWYGAVLRGDMGAMVIGAPTN